MIFMVFMVFMVFMLNLLKLYLLCSINLKKCDLTYYDTPVTKPNMSDIIMTENYTDSLENINNIIINDDVTGNIIANDTVINDIVTNNIAVDVNMIDNKIKSENKEENEDTENVMLVAKKAKILAGRNDDIANLFIFKLLTNKLVMLMLIVSIIILYTLLGQLFNLIRFVSEILVFMIIPIKIFLHVFSSDSDLKLNIENVMTETSDVKILKNIYRQSRKIKRIRLEYAGTLLRQISVVLMLNLLMKILTIFEMIPFIGLFSTYTYSFLLFIVILIQIPTNLINIFIDIVAQKFNINNDHNNYFTYPLSDWIIIWVKKLVGESKLTSIRTIRDIMLKYDCNIKSIIDDNNTDNTNDDNDNNKLFEALDNLGINKEYLKSIGFNSNNIELFVNKIKDKINTLLSDETHILDLKNLVTQTININSDVIGMNDTDNEIKPI